MNKLWLTINTCPGYNTDPIIKNCVYPPTHAVLGYHKDTEKYLSSEEAQYFPTFDTFNCTDYSAHNYIEAEINQWIVDKTISIEFLRFLSDNGFLDKNGKPNFNDQFNGILSGNTGQGNTFEKVIESIMRDGLVPESMFTDEPKSLAEYYNPKLITSEMRILGKKIFDYIEIKVASKHARLDDILDEGNVRFFDSYPAYKKKISPLNAFAKWELSIKPLNKTMNKVLKTADKQDNWVIKDNKRHKVPDYETFSFNEKLGFISFPETVNNEELNKYEIGESLPSIKLTRALAPIVKDIFLEE